MILTTKEGQQVGHIGVGKKHDRSKIFADYLKSKSDKTSETSEDIDKSKDIKEFLDAYENNKINSRNWDGWIDFVYNILGGTE